MLAGLHTTRSSGGQNWRVGQWMGSAAPQREARLSLVSQTQEFRPSPPPSHPGVQAQSSFPRPRSQSESCSLRVQLQQRPCGRLEFGVRGTVKEILCSNTEEGEVRSDLKDASFYRRIIQEPNVDLGSFRVPELRRHCRGQVHSRESLVRLLHNPGKKR